MPLYYCEHCNYKTKLLGNYKQHLKTKKHYHNINDYSIENEVLGLKSQKEPVKSQKEPAKSQKEPVKSQEFCCEYCNESFSTFANMRRHDIHRCKENPNIIDKILEAKNKKIKSFEKAASDWNKEKQMLYTKISELISKVGDTNIQNNIIINNYGDEDMSHITNKIKNELLKIPYGAIPKLIESVHFNDEKPENKNILMPNKKENMLKVYDGDKWIYKNKNETIRDLIDSKYMIIDNHYDEVKTDVPNGIQRTYTKFHKFYDEGDEELVKELKKECDLVLLNHRE